ncbi:hypothetical protein GGS20DRAFT_598390 [Poronia punctata]|nr:hypothetical protein GGS20DRAFT_598390 [Poronia punctata]
MQRISSFMPRKTVPLTITGAPKHDSCLPMYNNTQKKYSVPMKALLGHCLYRRVAIWTVLALILTAVFFLHTGWPAQSRSVLSLVQGGMATLQEAPVLNGAMVLPNQEILKEELVEEEGPQELNMVIEQQAVVDNVLQPQEEIPSQMEQDVIPDRGEEVVEEEEEEEIEGSGDFFDINIDDGKPKWLQYKHLDGYYRGLRALVSPADYNPGYPGRSPKPTPIAIPHHAKLPKPAPYRPHPDYKSDKWQRTNVPVTPCYVDAGKSIPPPDLYAYRGIVQGQPVAAIGSHDALGLRADICFDRFGRYGPYGLGYDIENGGAVGPNETESEGSEVVWETSGQINWNDVNWGDSQSRCSESNRERFFTGNRTRDAELADTGHKKLHRTAVVVRSYVGFTWTNHAVLNFRAMISELNLRSGGEYDVHFLLHVRDNNAPIWADPAVAQEILDQNVPPEFHGLCTLWSEAQMRLFYPGNFGDSFENPSNGDIHGVYRSAHMPLQHFALAHPEYAHFWNWEMDMRWTGSYYELFDRLGIWGANQSRVGAWERAAKYYIPGFHGTWENFTHLVDLETQASKNRPLLGPVNFAGKVSLDQNEDFLPPSCAAGIESPECGVGEDADLIALNPIFDVEESGWVFASDVTGYETALPRPPRRCSIVTASRLSRRLLSVMHEETWRLHHSMFSEMFPATIAFHRGLKAVYAPHPVFIDRDWPQEEIDKAFNGGKDHSSGGEGSPFNLNNEHNHKGTTWYYNSEFAGLLWRRWLGYAQMDGRGRNGGRAGEGKMRGGREEEADPSGSGRLCLRSMLVHPIKWEDPAERED